MPSFSNTLEESIHRAIDYANERHHEYATLEHLLLSLIDDRDASSVMRACNVDIERLRAKLTDFLDKELTNLILDQDSEAQPTASFQRVIHRANVHVQSSGREAITGANVIVALFAERESNAAIFLQEQDMTRFDAINFVSHGISKRKMLQDEAEITASPMKVTPEPKQPIGLIFISHCDEDKESIVPVINVFIKHGFNVWIDNPRGIGLQNHPQVSGIRASQNWQESIRDALNKSDCVITFWSKAAVQPQRTELHEEARIAKKAGKLIQLSIEPRNSIDLPLGFSEKQVISIRDDLVGYKNSGSIDLSDIIADINELLHRKGLGKSANAEGNKTTEIKIKTSAKPIPVIQGPALPIWGEDGKLHLRPPKSKPTNNRELRHQTLEAICETTSDLIEIVKSGRAQARQDYRECLQKYHDELLKGVSNLNPIVLETRYQEIYEMLNIDKTELPDFFVVRLKTWAKSHQGLRTHYSAIIEYCERQHEGRLLRPIPMDEVLAVEQIMKEENHIFGDEIADAFENAPSPVASYDAIGDKEDLSELPGDELIDLNSERPRSFWLATLINAIWRSFVSPPASLLSKEWRRVFSRLEPYASRSYSPGWGLKLLGIAQGIELA